MNKAPSNPKVGNGLVQLIQIGKSISLKWVNVLSEKYIGLDKQFFQRKILNIFLHIFFSICFG